MITSKFKGSMVLSKRSTVKLDLRKTLFLTLPMLIGTLTFKTNKKYLFTLSNNTYKYVSEK
jgi:hypothetical protein